MWGSRGSFTPEGQAGIALPDFPGEGDNAAGAAAQEAGLTRGGAESRSAGVRITIEDPDLCQRYLGAVIRGVSVGPSPSWLAEPLAGGGGAARSTTS